MHARTRTNTRTSWHTIVQVCILESPLCPSDTFCIDAQLVNQSHVDHIIKELYYFKRERLNSFSRISGHPVCLLGSESA